MKEYWFLIASLPTVQMGEKPALSRADFRAACEGQLSEDKLRSVDAVLENREPPAGIATGLWNGEIQLRDAIVRMRAKNRGADASRFLQPFDGFSATIEKQVTDAFARPNPLEQEMALDHVRWSLADELALTGPFGLPGVLAFAVKVRIAERWAELEEEVGKNNVESLIEDVLTEEK